MYYDVEILNPKTVDIQSFKVEAGAVGSITPGKPVKIGGTGNNYVVLLATGDPEIGTDRVVGIAQSTSTDTASADGEVKVAVVKPGVTKMRAKVTTPGNMDTAAELLGILQDSVTFDLTSTTFTVDENEGDDIDVHGLLIVGGDIEAGTVDFYLKEATGIGGLIVV